MKTFLKNLEYKTPILIMLLFAFSRDGWGKIISDVIWGSLLLIAALLSVVTILKNKCARTISLSTLYIFLMIVVILVNNNYEFNNQTSFLSAFVNSIFILFIALMQYVILSKIDNAHIFVMKIMTVLGIINAVVTAVFMIFPNLYYATIYPSLLSYYADSMRNNATGPLCGLYVTYGVNVLFIAIALSFLLINFVVDYINKKKFSFFKLTLILFLIFMILIIGKRSILISLLLSFICVYFLYGNRKNKFFKFLLFVAIGLILILLLYSISPEVSASIDRIIGFSLEEEFKSADSRQKMWNNALNLFFNRPILGYGWRYIKYNLNYGGIGRDVHNCYLQLLAENGIIGSLPFFAFFFSELKRNFKTLRLIRKSKAPINNGIKIELFSFSFQIIFLSLIFFTTTMYSYSFMALYIICCGMATYWNKFAKRTGRGLKNG